MIKPWSLGGGMLECPLCGAGYSMCQTSNPEIGYYKFACGTTFVDGSCEEQSKVCLSRSFRVLQRAATIAGILAACAPLERTEVINVLRTKGFLE